MTNIVYNKVIPIRITGKVFKNLLNECKCDTESLDEVGFSGELTQDGYKFILNFYGKKESDYKLLIAESVYAEIKVQSWDKESWGMVVLSNVQKEILQYVVDNEVKCLKESENEEKEWEGVKDLILENGYSGINFI